MKLTTAFLSLTLATGLLATSAQSKSITVELTNEEAQLAVQLANTYEVPLQVNGPCSSTEFRVVSRVRGFNRASWSLRTSTETYQLSKTEIRGLIDLHNRLEVPVEKVDPITIQTEVTIKGGSCGFTPSTWTVTYDDQE